MPTLGERHAAIAPAGRVFDPRGDAWLRWRDWKLARRPAGFAELVVEVRDPRALTRAEHGAIVERCRRANMAIYASGVRVDDGDMVRVLGGQLGLRTVERGPSTGADGIARIACATAGAGRRIPFTDRRMRWHTDGCTSAAAEPVRSVLLHCVRAAREGGDICLIDPELAWMLLREAGPELVAALMQADAFTIAALGNARATSRGEHARAVFSVDAATGDLHTRYTARRRGVRWKFDATTTEAAARLLRLMDRDATSVIRARLEPGMGIVCNNVLRSRDSFVDDPASPRLMLRARFLERVAGTERAWAGFTFPCASISLAA